MPHYRLFLWAAIRKPSTIFGKVCESLSALTVCVFNSKLYACIYLNIHRLLWLTCQRFWSGRIGNLHISMVCSSLHGREGWNQQSLQGFKETWTRTACWRQSWFWQGKDCFLHYHWEILTTECYRPFIKTPKNQINFRASDDPFKFDFVSFTLLTYTPWFPQVSFRQSQWSL